MKRLFLFLLLAVLSVVSVHAQKTKASAYVLSSNTEQSYQTLTSPTVLGSKYSTYGWNTVSFIGDTGRLVASCQKTSVKTIPIGFQFPFADSSFTGVAINANGVLFLGQDSVSPGFTTALKNNNCENTAYAIFCMPSSSGTNIGAYKKKEDDYSRIAYKNIQENDVNWFVVEYKDILIRNITTYPKRDTVVDTVSFQIKLGSNGHVHFHFDTLYYSGTATNLGFDVGLKGNILKKGYTSFWDYAVIGSKTSWTQNLQIFTQRSSYPVPNMLSISATNNPPKNLLYKFTQAPNCKKPISPEEIKVSNIGTSSVSIELPKFASEIAKDGSMILLAPKNTNIQITDGIDYTLIDSIGDVKILTAVYASKITVNNINPSTEYAVYAVNYNSICSEGPVYSDAKKIEFKTLLPAPTELRISKTDTNALSIKTACKENYHVLLCLAGKSSTSLVNIPENVALGDVLNNGDTVIYKGEPGTFVFPNLKQAQAFRFNAYSIHQGIEKFEYSADYLSVADRTASKIPLLFNFAEFSASQEQAGFISFLRSANSPSVYRFQKTEMNNPDFIPCFEARLNETVQGTPLADTSDIVLPSVYLGQGKHRLVFQKAFLTPPQRPKPTGPYQFSDNDSLCVQISTSLEPASFKTIYTVNHENYSENTDQYTKTIVNINGYQGEKIYIRLVFYTKSKNYSRLTDFKVEEFQDCEVPIDLIAVEDSMMNESAYINWTEVEGVADPISYLVQYKQEEVWSEGFSVTEKPALLDKLPSGAIVSARAQANCGNGEYSFWSDPSPKFRTLFSLPYFSNFSEVKSFDKISRWAGYELYNFYLSKSSEPIDLLNYSETKPANYDYVILNWRAQENENPSYALALDNFFSSFACVPEIVITDTSQRKILSFDLSVNDGYTENTIEEEIPEETAFYVLITQTPNVFEKSNIVASFGQGTEHPLSSLDSLHVEIDISKYKGKIQIAFYSENASNNNLYNTFVFIDNIAVDYACKLPSDLKTDEIDKTSAKLSWKSPGQKTILKYWVKGNSKIEDSIVLENNLKTYTLENLVSGANYVWAVQNACENQSFSPAVNQEFTTEYCDTVSNSRIKSNGKTQTIIAWEGKAAAYNFRYKEADSSVWNIVRTNTKEISCEKLKPGTRYEYSIQSQCAAEDTSDISLWSQTKTFRTLFLTCYAPTEFKTHKTMWNRAIFTWKSDAQTMEMCLFKEDGSDEVIYDLEDKDTCTIFDLLPNTSYKAVLRAICTPGDESEWTDTLRFTTSETPPCAPPKELSVTVLSKSSALLSWVANTNNNTFHICYREKDKVWDTVKSLNKPSYTLDNLKTNVVYQWRVQGVCEEGLYSTWSDGDSFQCVSIEGLKDANISVFSKNHQIHILNPSAIVIDKIDVYSSNGQILFSSEVHAKDHLIIPLEKTDNIRIIRIYSGKKLFTHKIFVQ